MNTMLNIGIAVVSPALIISVMIFMINSVNKRIDDMNRRIDDLRSEMKSDHAKLASALGDLIFCGTRNRQTIGKSQSDHDAPSRIPRYK